MQKTIFKISKILKLKSKSCLFKNFTHKEVTMGLGLGNFPETIKLQKKITHSFCTFSSSF